MGLFDAFKRPSTDLRQPRPESFEGSGWAVFEHLIDLDIEDEAAFAKMTPEQQAVFTFNLARQEVNSSGFDSYLNSYSERFDKEMANFPKIAPGVGELVAEAVELYKADADSDFDELDDRFSALEGETGLDDVVDTYIAANPDGFFR